MREQRSGIRDNAYLSLTVPALLDDRASAGAGVAEFP
jgi:hypothetical protein